LTLSDGFAVLQASMFDSFLFRPFSLLDDCLSLTEVDVGNRNVVQTLETTIIIAVPGEGFDLPLHAPRQEIAFQQDALLSVWRQRATLPCAYG